MKKYIEDLAIMKTEKAMENGCLSNSMEIGIMNAPFVAKELKTTLAIHPILISAHIVAQKGM